MHKGRLLKKLNAFMTQQTALRLFAAFATIFLILVIALALIARAVQEIYSGEQRKNRENTISNISISLEKAIKNNCQAFVERLYAEGVERLFDALSHEPKAASEMLSEIADNYPNIQSAVISAKSGDSVIGVSTGISPDPGEFISCLQYDYNTIISQFDNSSYSYNFYLINKPVASTVFREMESFTVAYKLISEREGQFLGILFLNFKRSEFRDMIGLSVLSSKENFFIVNQYDNIVLQAGDFYRPDELSYGGIVRGYNKTDDKIEIYGGNESGAPYKTVLTGAESVGLWAIYAGRVSFILAVVCFLFVLIVYCYVLFVSLYQNSTIKKSRKILEDHNKNDINQALIEDSSSLEGLVSKQVIYADSLEKQNSDHITLIKRKVIADLFTSNEPLEENHKNDQFDRIGIKTDQYFAVIAFDLNLSGGSAETAHKTEDTQLLRFVAENIFREYGGCDALLIKNTVACLVYDVNEFDIDSLREHSRQVIDICDRELAFSLRGGIGNIVFGVNDLPESYYRAVCALENSEKTGRSLCDYTESDSIRDRKSDYAKAIEEKYHLVNLIKTQDFENARKVLAVLIDTLATDPGISDYSFRLQVYETVCAAIENIFSFAEVYDEKLKENYEQARKILYCYQIAEIKNTALSVFDTALMYATQRSVHQDLFIDTVCRIVEENYSNPDMSVSFIAEKMNQNPRTLSAKFIKKTGRGLLDYIHSVRIEHAKTLLAKNKSVQEVSELVGYETPNTFIRVFKRYCNITPGSYQEIHRKK